MINYKQAKKRIARVTTAVMKSTNADLILLSALCELEVEHRNLFDDVAKMKYFIKNGLDNQ